MDVSRARLVTGPAAAEAAASINARAFTVGERVFFARGNNASTDGGDLLAHELTHVAQQGGAAAPSSWDQLPLVPDDDAREHAAARKMPRSQDSPRGMAIARDDDDDAKTTWYTNPYDEKFRTYIGKDEDEMLVNARRYLYDVGTWNLAVDMPFLLRHIKAVETAPFGNYITSDKLEFATYVVNSPALYPPEDKLEKALQPERLLDMVNRSRLLAMKQIGEGDDATWVTTDEGPARYFESVGWEVANAISRRLNDSMRRMVPRVADAGNGATPSHPFDPAVVTALMQPEVTFDFAAFRNDHPELVAEAERTNLYINAKLEIEFAYKRGLWHWVEVEPEYLPYATTEAVARWLFGDTKLAYLLTPLPPLWGFRDEDVGKFLQERREHLDELARQYQPNPAVLNQGDIDQATYENSPKFRADFEAGAFGGQHVGGTVDVPDLRPVPVPAPIYGFRADFADPMLELVRSPDGQKLARERALAVAASSHDALAAYDRLDENLSIVALIAKNIEALQLPNDVVAEIATTLQERQRGVSDTSELEPESAYQLADKQNSLLTRISRGTSEATFDLLLFGGVSKDDDKLLPDPGQLPDFTKKPLLEAGQAFLDALAAIDFPEVANQRLEHAQELLRNVRITAAEAGLHQTIPQIENAIATPQDRRWFVANNYDPKDLDERMRGLLGSFGQLRNELITDPAGGAIDLKSLEETTRDFMFETAVVADLESLDAAWAAVSGTHGFWQSGSDFFESLGIEDTNEKLYLEFRNDVYLKFKLAKTDEDKKAARDAFQKLTDRDDFKNHFKTVEEFLRRDARHKKWTKIIVAIAIAVVAFGLGQWAGAAALAEGGGWLEVAFVSGATEQGANIILNAAIFHELPTKGSLIVGFLSTTGMYAVFGKLARLGKVAGAAEEIGEASLEASKVAAADQAVAQASGFWAKTLPKLPGALAKYAQKGLFVEAMGWVSGQLQSQIDHGRWMTAEETEEMLVNGLVMAIGFEVGTHIIEPHIMPYILRKRGIDLEALEQSRNEIVKLAADLRDAPTPEKARTLREQELAYLAREKDAIEKLAELARTNPQLFPKGEPARLAALAEKGMASSELRKATVMLALEELGPNLYRVAPGSLDTVLALHQSMGSRLVSITTEPHSGMRTVTLETPDGTIQVKEKLADVGHRTTPPIAPEQARNFENWIEGTRLHDDPDTDALFRERLYELYARDPVGALAVAHQRYGYVDAEMPAPLEEPALTAASAFEEYRRSVEAEQIRTEQAEQASRAEPDRLTRADFEAYYAHGYRYDPLTRDWVPTGAVATGTGGIPASGIGGTTHVVGPVFSKAVGLQVLRKLAFGESEALRVAGAEPPEGFDSRANEWGLGVRKDGSYVLVRGGSGEVDWTSVPDLEPVAHTHPLRDPLTGAPRYLSGANGDGTIVAADLFNTAAPTDLVYLLPSTSDVHLVAITGVAHTAQTPYVHLGDGRIGNPTPGTAHDTVDIEIVSAQAEGTMTKDSPIIVYKARIRLMAGDTELWSGDFYQQQHPDIGDMPLEEPILRPEPLNPDAPLARLAAPSTKAGRFEGIGNLKADTVRRLFALGLDPADPVVKDFMSKLDAASAEELSALTQKAVDGKVAELKAWIVERGLEGITVEKRTTPFGIKKRLSGALASRLEGLASRLGLTKGSFAERRVRSFIEQHPEGIERATEVLAAYELDPQGLSDFLAKQSVADVVLANRPQLIKRPELRAKVEAAVSKGIDPEKLADAVDRATSRNTTRMLDYVEQLATAKAQGIGGVDEVMADLARGGNFAVGAEWMLEFLTREGLWSSVDGFEVVESTALGEREIDAIISGTRYQFKSWREFMRETFLKQVERDYELTNRLTDPLQWVFDGSRGLGDIETRAREVLQSEIDVEIDPRRRDRLEAIRDALPTFLRVE